MKVVIIIILACANLILSTHLLNHSRNHNKFRNRNHNRNHDKPKYMESVFFRKKIPIQHFSNEVNQTRFKEYENSGIKNLEDPKIVPSIGFGPRYNIPDRVARHYPNQAHFNDDTYVATYGTHENWYDKDKKAYIFDKNFERTEKYLLNNFKKAIDKNIKYDPKLVHVDDYKGTAKLNVDFTNAPKIQPEAVKTDMNYGELSNRKDNKVLRASTDPYSEIFGDRTVRDH